MQFVEYNEVNLMVFIFIHYSSDVQDDHCEPDDTEQEEHLDHEVIALCFVFQL